MNSGIQIPFSAGQARGAARDVAINSASGQYAPISAADTRKMQAVIDNIFADIGRLASRRGERLMVVDFPPEENRLCGNYSRKAAGEMILPSDALNATTQQFLAALYESGYKVHQEYHGPMQRLWSERGPQRMVISW